MLVSSAQPWQALHHLLRVPHFQVLYVYTNFNGFADQPARHRVAVPIHVNQAAAVHARRHALARLQALSRQRTQLRNLLRQPPTPARVEPIHEPPQKSFVVRALRKIAAAAQHQLLIHRLLEAMMPLLDVPVLVPMIRLYLLRRQAIVSHQAFVTRREFLLVRRVVHRQTHAVGAMAFRHAAQLHQRVLQAFAQAFETLREADRRCLPVRVGQHEVVHQVVERPTADRHVQLVHRREVGGAEPTGFMHLREEHFFRRSMRRAPALDVPLQRPQLTVGEPAWISSLQVHEDRLRLKSGIAVEQSANFVPNRIERIGPRRPVVQLGYVAGQLAQIAVFACRFVVHVGKPRCPYECSVVQKKLKQIANLSVGDHHKPPCKKSLR